MKTALSAVARRPFSHLRRSPAGRSPRRKIPRAGTVDFSVEDRAAFLDARIAALKAGLELNADQEKNWPALESAMRDLAKERAARFEAWKESRGENRDMSPVDRLAHASERLSARAGGLTETRRRRQAALRQPRRQPETPLRHPFHHGPQSLAPLAPRTRRLKRALKPAREDFEERPRPRGLPRLLAPHHAPASAAGSSSLSSLSHGS